MNTQFTEWERVRFWFKVDRQGDDECWEWKAQPSQRYGSFPVTRNGVSRNMRPHRVSYEMENGEIPDGMQVLHRCDNPRCVNPRHLFLGTPRENTDDKVAKGRQNKGEKVCTAVINEHIVREIRSRAEAGMKVFEIARDLDLTHAIVWHVVKRKTWKHVS